MDDPNDELTGKVLHKDGSKIVLQNLRSLTANVFQLREHFSSDCYCLVPSCHTHDSPQARLAWPSFSYSAPLIPLHRHPDVVWLSYKVESNEESIVTKQPRPTPKVYTVPFQVETLGICAYFTIATM